MSYVVSSDFNLKHREILQTLTVIEFQRLCLTIIQACFIGITFILG